MEPRKVQPTVMDVWEWPEFIAFAKRLGIRLDVDASYLQIELADPDHPVQVIHKYNCNDEDGKTIAPPMQNDNPLVEVKAGECRENYHVFEGMKVACKCGKKSRTTPYFKNWADMDPSKVEEQMQSNKAYLADELEDIETKTVTTQDMSHPPIIDNKTGRIVSEWDVLQSCYVDSLTRRRRE